MLAVRHAATAGVKAIASVGYTAPLLSDWRDAEILFGTRLLRKVSVSHRSGADARLPPLWHSKAHAGSHGQKRECVGRRRLLLRGDYARERGDGKGEEALGLSQVPEQTHRALTSANRFACSMRDSVRAVDLGQSATRPDTDPRWRRSVLRQSGPSRGQLVFLIRRVEKKTMRISRQEQKNEK